MDDDRGTRIIRKIASRIIPLLGFIFIVSLLDRVNIAFAALTMNRDLGIQPSTYGLAAGVFFVGYLLFQVPGNMIMARIGARRYFATIMVLWGAVSMAMALVRSGTHLVVARFFLGIAEAGFFPGTILFLTLWFPSAFRGRIVAGFMFAAPISYIIGGPISSLILGKFDGWYGLAGWQWLFIVEGMPAVIGALLVYLLLEDGPEKCVWLTQPEKDWLSTALAAKAPEALSTTRGSVFNVPVGMLALTYFGMQVGAYGIALWLPQIISEGGFGTLATGFITAVPYLAASAAMLYWGHRADKANSSTAHVWAPILAAGVALAASALANTLMINLALITVMTAFLFASMPAFWAYSTNRYMSTLGAIGIAIINASGSLGGFAGPLIVGQVRALTNSFADGLLAIAVILIGASATLWRLDRRQR